MHPIDQVELAFSQDSLFALQLVLGLVMFGVALDLKVDDFRRLIADPKAPVLGLLTQFLVLPMATAGLVWVLPIPASMGLGMLLVAACPGGNVSNFITQLGGGRVSTSVGMTAVSTLGAVVMTPFNLTFWGSRVPRVEPLLTEIALDPVDMLRTVALLLLVPVALGMTLSERAPTVAARLQPIMKRGSVLFFVAFIAIAFAGNVEHFLAHIQTVFLPVLLLNSLALGLGYGVATAAGLPEPDRRALCIEVGIQNSGLGLVLIFAFFGGLGGMAVVAAWWGIWHVIAGLSLATWWIRRDRAEAPPAG